MPIDARRITLAAVFVLVGCLTLARPGWSATIEVEEDDEDMAAASPTPVPVAEKKAVEPAVVKEEKKAVGPKEEKKEVEAQPVVPIPTAVKEEKVEVKPAPAGNAGADIAEGSVISGRPRIKINDKVGFYYFVSAGYLAVDPAQVHAIGKVIRQDQLDVYSTSQRPTIELNSEKLQVKKGDLLVVYRTVRPVIEPHSGNLGTQVENLAIVQVVEAQKQRHLVEVKKSFRPFEPGDKVALYETEVKRWKQAQLKKETPAHQVQCYVAGSEDGRNLYSQGGFIFLSAGTKKGVVEGLKFNLYRVNSGEFMKENVNIPMGVAQVLYAGPNASTAQILRSQDSIETGFVGLYRP